MKTGKKTWSAIIAVLLGIAMSTCYGAVIGDFEGGMDNWVAAWEGSPILANSTIGVTSGNESLSLTTTGGYYCLQWNAPTVPRGVNGCILEFDVTMIASEWPVGLWTKVADKIALNSDGPSGWKEYTTTTAVDRLTGESTSLDWGRWWDAAPDVFKTYSLEITDYDLTGATWFQINIAVQGGDGVAHFYFDNIKLLDPPATIIVEPGGDIAAANAMAVAGDIIGIAAGTYPITEAIEIKDGVTYRGEGSGQTIIDCGSVTRAFVGWGDGSQNDDLPYSETGYPANTSGPKDWVIQGLSIINGVADDVNKSVRRVGDPTIDPPLAANEILNPDKSASGGGILVDNGAEGTLIDVAFDNCNALAIEVDNTDPAAPTTTYLGSGGAVEMGWATVNIFDCTFTNNSTSNDGGAVRASNPDPENWDLSIENSTFTNNSARDDGGAIYAVRRNLSIINCVADGNKGGLDPAVMADNVSGDPDGGFLYITGTNKIDGTSYTADTPPLEMTSYGGVVNIDGCTINNGEARRGGAIRSNSAARLVVTNTSFTNCNATDNGGAIFGNSPSPINPAAIDPNDPNAASAIGEPGIYLDGVTIDGCIAADDGGGMDIDNWGVTSNDNYIEYPKVVINNCAVRNCRAGSPAPDDGNRDGGGIRLNNVLDVTITNTVVENCTAGRNGAGIMVDGVCNSIVMDGVRVSGCVNDEISGEGGDGTGVNMDQDDNAFVLVTNCIFDNNINNQDDGAIRIDGDNITVANCTFVGNKTADHGVLYFKTAREDPAVVTNKAINNLFVNNDTSVGSDCVIDWDKDLNNNITLNNGFFGNILDNDSLIEDTADADLGLTANFIAAVDPLVDTAGGDYHLAAGSEAIDAGTAVDAPDHDFDDNVRPQGAAHDVGAYESPAN